MRKRKPFIPGRGLTAGITITMLSLLILIPLASILAYSFRLSWSEFWALILRPNVLQAFRTSILCSLIAAVVNCLFGLCASWLITKFDFRGRQVLSTLIDIPFSISPVIAGLAFIMTFGRMGWATPLIERINDLLGTDIALVFSVPGVVLATIFVTFPFVSRELIPVMQAQDNAEEEAAAMRRQRISASAWSRGN